MTFRSFIFMLILGTLLCVGVGTWTLISINPDTLGIIGVALFTASWAMALLGMLTLVGIFIRIKLIKDKMLHFHAAAISFRQAVLLSSFTVSTAFLERFYLLSWWNFFIMLMLIMSIELFFSSSSHRRLLI